MTDAWSAKELELHLEIDKGIRSAERLFSMADVPEDDEEAFEEMNERLYHCEVCTVREVLDVFWPPVQQYIDWLRDQIPEAPK